MNKLLIICGPTATGKTNLGIKLAKKFNGEIVSADSRQVYIGMDIGTGKDLPVNSKLKVQNSKLQPKTKNYQIGYYLFERIPVWLLDVVAPDQKFTVADYYNLAWKVIKDIWQRSKLPIIVGGTGFYIKVLIEGIDTLGIEPDWLLRKELQSCHIRELQDLLKKADFSRFSQMNYSDQNNPRRLLRALEVALAQKRDKNNQKITPKPHCFDILSCGLFAPLRELYRQIDFRIEKQIKEGAKQEVEKLLRQGLGWDLPSMTAMGYREWRQYFGGQRTQEEVVQRWKFDEHDYARRQMTWFREALRQAQGKIQWFDITGENWGKKVEKSVKDWYSINKF